MGGEEVHVEGAINFATDEGHKGAEVLQGSWELFFKVMNICRLFFRLCIVSIQILTDLNQICAFPTDSYPRFEHRIYL